MKNWLIILIVTMLAACESSDFEETDTGLKYKLVREGNGEKPRNQDVILMHMKYEDESGNELYNSSALGGPAPIQFNDSIMQDNGSLEEVFRLIENGDSLVFKVIARTLFNETFKMGVPDTINPASVMTFYLGIEDIMTVEEYTNYSTELHRKRAEENERTVNEQLKNDIATIDSYLEEQGITADTTESGIRYVVRKEGSGPAANSHARVSVDYAGYLLDGTLFDTSWADVAREHDMYNSERSYEPYTFYLRKGSAIEGWVEGISYLKEGSEATLYIPSPLGYGPNQAGDKIAPNSILVFDVNVVDVEPNEAENQ